MELYFNDKTYKFDNNILYESVLNEIDVIDEAKNKQKAPINTPQNNTQKNTQNTDKKDWNNILKNIFNDPKKVEALKDKFNLNIDTSTNEETPVDTSASIEILNGINTFTDGIFTTTATYINNLQNK